jgi:diguanylate cyclase (GGDEF)-like protein/PAS domain S-box-containing protein
VRDRSHRGLARPGPTLLPAGNNCSTNANAFPVLKDRKVQMPETMAPERLLAAILGSTEDALLSFALDGTIQTWSRGAERLYGYLEAEMAGQLLARLLPAREGPMYDGLLRAAINGEFPHCESEERLHKDGSVVRVALSHVPIRNGRGEITGILERGRVPLWNSGGEALEAQLRFLAEQMPLALWTTDQDLRITSNWGAGLVGARIGPGELVGRSIFEYLKCQDPHTAPIAQHYEALRGASARFEYKRKNRVLEVHLEPLRSSTGEIIGCVGAGLDITERKEGEERMRYQATHDALTGLANYREFLDTLEREVCRGERSNRSFAVLLLDLDELKRINDRLGHLAGNRALQRLAEAMKEQCRSTDLAARYGGDEFAVLLIDADSGMARLIAGRVESALRSEKKEPPLKVSIGCSVYPDDGRTAQELLEVADQRLYQRKRTARQKGAAAR